MKIDNGIIILEVSSNIPGMFIYPTIMWDDDNMILVDAGYGGQYDVIRDACIHEGIHFESINKIIITHQDLDHFGGLPEFLEVSKHKIEVMAHEDDKPYIQGEKPLVRLNSNFLNSMPKDRQKIVKQMFENFVPVDVETTLSDNQKLPFCGGIKVIHTPGHTPGHLCLYHERSKTLIVGDAMNIMDGNLLGPRKEILEEGDYEIAIDSLKKLLKFDVKNIVTYHGGLYTNKPHESIENLIK
jgi:glyoxylase-like metal-dependent hydrolase (beta-lactamase superfamily II)